MDWTRAPNRTQTDGDAVLLCVHAGRREPHGKKRDKKKERKQKRTTPRSTKSRLDRKGRVARAMRRPQGTRTALEAAQERGAGAGGERPVLGAQTGPRMDEDPVGPHHRFAGGPLGYKHGMRDGMGPHNNPGD